MVLLLTHLNLQFFGGWPNEPQDFPVDSLTAEDIDTMKEYCSLEESIEVPNIPIKTITGMLGTDIGFNANESLITEDNEIETSSDMSISDASSDISTNTGFGVPAARPFRPKYEISISVSTGKTATLKLQRFEKRNAPDDNFFFCHNNSKRNDCRGVLVPENPADVSDDGISLYRVKCTNCTRSLIRYICKICHSQCAGNKDFKCSHKSKGKKSFLSFIFIHTTRTKLCLQTFVHM